MEGARVGRVVRRALFFRMFVCVCVSTSSCCVRLSNTPAEPTAGMHGTILESTIYPPCNKTGGGQKDCPPTPSPPRASYVCFHRARLKLLIAVVTRHAMPRPPTLYYHAVTLLSWRNMAKPNQEAQGRAMVEHNHNINTS